MSEVLSVELSAEDKARLEWASEKTQRSEADLLREAAQEYLDDLEDYYLGVEAMQTLEAIRTGKEDTIPLEQLEQDLGFYNTPVDPAISRQIQ